MALKCLSFVALTLFLGAGNVTAAFDPGITVETELLSLNLGGLDAPMPLAHDPSNALGDSIEGYGFVNSAVYLTLSSQRPTPGPRSLGSSHIYSDDDTLPADVQSGDLMHVDSFFDVFFDITFTDTDPRAGRDYAGLSDGASIVLQDNGAARFSSNGTCIADTTKNNFGCLPQVGDALSGAFTVIYPLGGDINGNGLPDVIEFLLGTMNIGGVTNSSSQGGQQFDSYSGSWFLEGAVLDEVVDPPFSFSLTGPTTAQQQIVIPGVQQQTQVPVATPLALMALGLVGMGMVRRRIIKGVSVSIDLPKVEQ